MIYNRKHTAVIFAFVMTSAFLSGIIHGYSTDGTTQIDVDDQVTESVSEIRDGESEPGRLPPGVPGRSVYRELTSIQLLPDAIHDPIQSVVRGFTAAFFHGALWVGLSLANAGIAVGSALKPLPSWLVVNVVHAISYAMTATVFGYFIWDLKRHLSNAGGI